MRILFLCHRETDVKIGGLAEFLHFLPISLKKQNIESIIYTASDSEESHRLLENGVKWYSGPFAKPALFTSRKKLTPLFKLCEREKIDLIHAQGLYRSGYIALQIRKKLGIPYVITSHSDILTNNPKALPDHFATRLTHDPSDALHGRCLAQYFKYSRKK